MCGPGGDDNGHILRNGLLVLARSATGVCQAALPQHWLDSAPTGAERDRRRAALDNLAVVRDGYTVMDGPAVLDLIRCWDRGFSWQPSKDRGALITDQQGRLIETGGLSRALLTP